METKNLPRCKRSDRVHESYCDVCGPRSVEMHEAAIHVRAWADAIADLAFRVHGEETTADARGLLQGIEGLAWAIVQRVEAEIEGETLESWSGPRAVELVSGRS